MLHLCSGGWELAVELPDTDMATGHTADANVFIGRWNHGVKQRFKHLFKKHERELA